MPTGNIICNYFNWIWYKIKSDFYMTWVMIAVWSTSLWTRWPLRALLRLESRRGLEKLPRRLLLLWHKRKLRMKSLKQSFPYGFFYPWTIFTNYTTGIIKQKLCSWIIKYKNIANLTNLFELNLPMLPVVMVSLKVYWWCTHMM